MLSVVPTTVAIRLSQVSFLGLASGRLLPFSLHFLLSLTFPRCNCFLYNFVVGGVLHGGEGTNVTRKTDFGGVGFQRVSLGGIEIPWSV